MKQKKQHSKGPLAHNSLQGKSFLLWFFLLFLLLGLNTIAIKPDGCLHISINQLFDLAKAHLVESIDIQAVEAGGPQWYCVRGSLKKDSAALSTLINNNPNWNQHSFLKKKTASVIPDKFEAVGRLTEARYTQLTDGTFAFPVHEKPSGSFWSSLLSSTVPFIIVLLFVYFMFMRQIRIAGRGAMNFGRSRARLLQEDKKRVTFKDVAGCDEAKEEVQEIIDFLKNPKRFEEIGGRIPKGCLMVGSPGTGKTLLAKAIAGEANVPFFSISGSDFVEMFVGVGASRVRDMFEQAKQNSPCLLFIDEIDAVGRKRGTGLGGGNDEREQTLNALLVEMDGFESRDGIIIVAATNRPDVLDNALLRPGRFDRQIVLDLPDINGRQSILEVHAKKIKLHPTVDLKIVARNTSGYSGADLANLLNEAALLATRRDHKSVELSDLSEARDKISFGRERKKLMDDKDKKLTAFHEAGHAIVQAIVDTAHLMPVHKVTIVPRGRSLGSTMMLPTKDILNYSKTYLLGQICCAMGGRIAEELIFQEPSSDASSDIQNATALARHMVCDWGMSELGPVCFEIKPDYTFIATEVSHANYSEQTAQQIDRQIAKIIQEQYQRAAQILKEHQKELELLASMLQKYETLDGQYVYEIVNTGTLDETPLLQTLQPVAKEVSAFATDDAHPL